MAWQKYYKENPAYFALKSSRAAAKRGGYVALDCSEEFLNKRLKEALEKGVCQFPGCSNKLTKGRGGLNIDHDHVTGRFRGIICRPCNIFLGMVEAGRTFARYLEYVMAHSTPAP